ncbi:MAG: GNAT family N-acetyltransferase [Desulfurococcaceae archaeon TW002]
MEEVRVEKKGSVYMIRFNDGSKAWLSFKEENNKLYLLETYTPEQHRGKGYGAKLVEAAIRDAGKRNLKIIPVCSYAIYYFLKNKDARKVLAEEYSEMSDSELEEYFRKRVNEERMKQK